MDVFIKKMTMKQEKKSKDVRFSREVTYNPETLEAFRNGVKPGHMVKKPNYSDRSCKTILEFVPLI